MKKIICSLALAALLSACTNSGVGGALVQVVAQMGSVLGLV